MSSDQNDLKKRIETEPDFINSKKYDYSLEKFTEWNPDGIKNDKIVASLLCITPEEVTSLWNKIVHKGRQFMGMDVK